MATAGTTVLWNASESQSHEQQIIKLLKDATRFDCAVAFAKWSGFSALQKALVNELKNGMKARFLVGLDFCQTEPKVLEELLTFKKNYGVEVFVSVSAGSCTFHPKIYRFEYDKSVSTLVGSANLTRGGLSDNYEVSAILHRENGDRTLAYLNRLVTDGDVKELTPSNLETYRKRHSAYDVLRRIAEKRLKRALEANDAGIDALREILREMSEGGPKSEFATQVRVRERSRRQARTILNRIQDGPSLSRSNFLRLYDKLAGGLWHSGGLHRSKTRIAKNPGIFQEIVRVAAKEHTAEIPGTFDRVRELADKALGIGPNVLTEILQTYDNDRYAVMNQNSVKGMQLAGFSGFPEKPSRGAVDGSLYRDFCMRAVSVRKKLSLKDLSQLDALFNYSYWR